MLHFDLGVPDTKSHEREAIMVSDLAKLALQIGKGEPRFEDVGCDSI